MNAHTIAITIVNYLDTKNISSDLETVEEDLESLIETYEEHLETIKESPQDLGLFYINWKLKEYVSMAMCEAYLDNAENE